MDEVVICSRETCFSRCFGGMKRGHSEERCWIVASPRDILELEQPTLGNPYRCDSRLSRIAMSPAYSRPAVIEIGQWSRMRKRRYGGRSCGCAQDHRDFPSYAHTIQKLGRKARIMFNKVRMRIVRIGRIGAPFSICLS